MRIRRLQLAVLALVVVTLATVTAVAMGVSGTARTEQVLDTLEGGFSEGRERFCDRPDGRYREFEERYRGGMGSSFPIESLRDKVWTLRWEGLQHQTKGGALTGHFLVRDPVNQNTFLSAEVVGTSVPTIQGRGAVGTIRGTLRDGSVLTSNFSANVTRLTAEIFIELGGSRNETGSVVQRGRCFGDFKPREPPEPEP